MKSKFLFPTWCAIVGYLLATPGFILGYLYTINKYEIPGFGFKMRERNDLFQPSFENFTNELAIFLVVGGLILIAFSKNKKEDELSAKLRLNSLYWSIMIYYLLYIVGLLFSITIGEIPFIGEHASELNLFTPLVIFIIRYNYLMHVNKESYLMSQPKFLPNSPYRKVGVFLSLISLVVFISVTVIKTKDLTDTFSSSSYLALVIGFMLWTFSRHKIEDEMVMQQRLENLQLAVYFNYGILLLATILFYSLNFLLVLLFAQISLLLFFIIRMEFINYKNNKLLNTFEGGLNYEK